MISPISILVFQFISGQFEGTFFHGLVHAQSLANFVSSSLGSFKEFVLLLHSYPAPIHLAGNSRIRQLAWED